LDKSDKVFFRGKESQLRDELKQIPEKFNLLRKKELQLREGKKILQQKESYQE
jgi:hypothetical protein